MSLWSTLGTVAGGIGGFLIGGPQGASIGAKLGSSLGGGADQSNAAGGAAKDQRAATDAALAEQRRQFDLQRSDTAPYRQAGVNALAQLTDRVQNVNGNTTQWGQMMRLADKTAPSKYFSALDSAVNHQGNTAQFDQLVQEAGNNAPSDTYRALQGAVMHQVTPQEVMQDPGYQFGLQQGQQALDRKIAAMGGRVSGAALKAAARYGTDYASTGYNAAYQRRNDHIAQLGALDNTDYGRRQDYMNRLAGIDTTLYQRGQAQMDRLGQLDNTTYGRQQDQFSRLAGIDNTAYQRGQDRLNRLARLAGIGETSTAASSAAGSQAANAISRLYGEQGDASAAARIAQANIWGNTGNQLAALYDRNFGGRP